jgi:hypothetical protein
LLEALGVLSLDLRSRIRKGTVMWIWLLVGGIAGVAVIVSGAFSRWALMSRRMAVRFDLPDGYLARRIIGRNAHPPADLIITAREADRPYPGDPQGPSKPPRAGHE